MLENSAIIKHTYQAHLRHWNLHRLLHNDLLVNWNLIMDRIWLRDVHNLGDAHWNMLGHLVGHWNTVRLVHRYMLVDWIRMMLDYRHGHGNCVRLGHRNRLVHVDLLRYRYNLLNGLVNGHLDADVHRMRDGNRLGHRDDLGDGDYFGHRYGFRYVDGLVDYLDDWGLVVFLVMVLVLVVFVMLVMFVGERWVD